MGLALMCTLLLVARKPLFMWLTKPVGWVGQQLASFTVIYNLVACPGCFALCLVSTSLTLTAWANTIQNSSMRSLFLTLTHIVNVILAVISGILLTLWIVIAAYDAFASGTGLLHSTDIAMLMSSDGRQIVDADRMAGVYGRYKHLYEYVSSNNAGLEVKPGEFILKIAGEGSDQWEPVINFFAPIHDRLKLSLLTDA